MNKKIVVGIVVVVAVAIAAFAFFHIQSKTTSTEATSHTPGTAKINPEAVCRGALAYMTFTDSQSAEVFVQECIDGKHPEVFERYNEQIGVKDGKAI